MKGDSLVVFLFQDKNVLVANTNYHFPSTNTNHQLLSSQIFKILHSSIDND